MKSLHDAPLWLAPNVIVSIARVTDVVWRVFR